MGKIEASPEELTTQEHKTKVAAKAMLCTTSDFHKEYIPLWHMTPPCEEATGLRLLECFRGHCQTYVFDYKRGADPGVKHAANEMYRLIAMGQADYTTSELNGFVKWYEKLKHRIGRAVGGLFDFHGDGFGDLCDSLPLAGVEIVRKCLATGRKPVRDGFLEECEIEAAVREFLGPDWAKFICHGENYVESALEHQARKWFLYNLHQDEEWFPESDYGKADYAFHGDD